MAIVCTYYIHMLYIMLQFWQRTRLCVQTSAAVWTVEGLDELLEHLHDHNLTLKAMANTR